MNQHKVSALSIVLVSLVIPCGASARQAPKPVPGDAKSSTSAGREIFSSTCASCHGLDGRGGERGPDIVTRPEITRLSDEDTLKILRAGIPGKGMPPFVALGAAKLSGVLTYLRTLQGNRALAPVAGDAALGRELYRGKANCAECHMVNGAGGFLGPDLSNYAGNHSAADIRSAIVNPENKTGPRRIAAKVTTKDGKTFEGLVRNEDNFSLQLQTPDGAFHFFSKSDLATIDYRRESLMPTDYGAKLSPAELDALVAYLVRSAQEKSNHKK
jgi:cytochrome c oxidase cbb3-type subunit III